MYVDIKITFQGDRSRWGGGVSTMKNYKNAVAGTGYVDLSIPIGLTSIRPKCTFDYTFIPAHVVMQSLTGRTKTHMRAIPLLPT